ncbi:protein of unknown function (plasmid) [Streptantibioticus cattleyicolor NRRL 8057 = DSM 46488]|nr:protein of unknown function [Streptantibioticus cattleyicolor NRRL 8057 = DSM 46488]
MSRRPATCPAGLRPARPNSRIGQGLPRHNARHGALRCTHTGRRSSPGKPWLTRH